MDVVQETEPSLLRRAFRWLREFERATEMQPVDLLELRVAKLERRLATLNLTDDRAHNPFPVRNALEV